jgi:hypothetical protein
LDSIEIDHEEIIKRYERVYIEKIKLLETYNMKEIDKKLSMISIIKN